MGERERSQREGVDREEGSQREGVRGSDRWVFLAPVFSQKDSELTEVGGMTKIKRRWEDDENKPAKINRADYSPTAPLGVEIHIYKY